MPFPPFTYRQKLEINCTKKLKILFFVFLIDMYTYIYGLRSHNKLLLLYSIILIKFIYEQKYSTSFIKIKKIA